MTEYRAGISRTFALVVAPFAAAAATGAAACEFCTAEMRNDGLIIRALRVAEATGVFNVADHRGEPPEPAAVQIHAQAQRNPAASQLIECVRKME